MQHYDPRNIEEFAAKLKREASQILVVGHSNTRPMLVALLSGTAVDSMDDSEFKNLYQLVLIGDNAT